MPECAFTFGGRPCVINTYPQVEIGATSGYVAFVFTVDHDGYSLRPLADPEGEALTFVDETEEGALAQACECLARQFGPQSDDDGTRKTTPGIRHVQPTTLLNHRKAALKVRAQCTIRPGDYVVVTEKGATPLAGTPWPGKGAILARALEGIEAGHCGSVRDISSKAGPDCAGLESTEATQRVSAALHRYAGWLKHDRTSASIRAAVDGLGMVLEQHGEAEAIAAAIAKVSAEVERLHARDLKQLFRNGLHDLRVILEVSTDEQ